MPVPQRVDLLSDDGVEAQIERGSEFVLRVLDHMARQLDRADHKWSKPERAAYLRARARLGG